MEYSLPDNKAYNLAKLHQETGHNFVERHGIVYVMLPDETPQAIINEILEDAIKHDSTLLQEQELENSRDEIVALAKSFLNDKLVSPNSNIDDIYAILSNQISNYPIVGVMMDNQIALMTNITGWVQGNHTPTENKSFYIFCFQLLVATLG